MFVECHYLITTGYSLKNMATLSAMGISKNEALNY